VKPLNLQPKINAKEKLLEPSDGNYNLVNLFLRVFGKMSEEKLFRVCCGFQVLCSAIGYAAVTALQDRNAYF